jgi:outer membrane protein
LNSRKDFLLKPNRFSLSLVSLLVGFLFSSPMILSAQTLTQLYEAARLSDAAFNSSRAVFDANNARAGQLVGSIAPNVVATANVSTTEYHVRPDGAKKLSQNRSFMTETGAIVVTQPLYRPEAWAAYRQAGPVERQALAQYEAAEQDLLVRVAQAYFDALTSEDTLSYVQAQKKAIEEQLLVARRSFEVGTDTISGVREAQARLALIEAQEISATSDLQNRRLTLRLITGVPDARPKRVAEGSLVGQPVESLKVWVDRAIENHPALRNAKLAMEVASLEVSKATSGHKPTIDAQLNFSATRNINGNASYTQSNTITNPSAAIVMRMPIFDGMTTTNQVREAVAMESKARSDQEGIRRKVEQAANSAYLDLKAGFGQVRAYEAARAASELALDANRISYTLGVRVNSDVLNSQSQLFQSKRDLAKARHDVLVGHLKLRQAAGVLSSSDLVEIERLLVP